MSSEPVEDFQQILAEPSSAYEEGLAFFRGEGMINRTIRRLAEDFERFGIDYALIGAVALNQHGYQRFTHDIDLLLTPEGLKVFREKLVGVGYVAAFPGATKRFLTAEGKVPLDIIISGEYPGDGLPKPVVFPEPSGNTVVIDGARTLVLPRLIELKLASGMTAADRLKDLADVQELMKVKKLGTEFSDQLDESVRSEYLKLYQGIEKARSIQMIQEQEI